jgi:cytochrome c biogenesis protein CcmG/thiol:disulfide interchange protein DsbE
MPGFYHGEVPRPRFALARLPAASIALTLALLSACSASGAQGDPGAAGLTTLRASNAATAELLPADVGGLPSFEPATYDELIRQLNGTPAVVNVWASWCGPCRQEAPLLAAAAKTFGERVQFLGVDVQDERGAARSFMHEFGWTYPSVYDSTGAIRDHLGFGGQPDTLFYDADGDIVARSPGPLDPATLRANINEALG